MAVVRKKRDCLHAPTHLSQPGWIVAAKWFGGSGSPPARSLTGFRDRLCSHPSCLGAPDDLWLNVMDCAARAGITEGDVR